MRMAKGGILIRGTYVRRLAAFLMTEEQFPVPGIAEIAEEVSLKLRDCGIFANEREAERRILPQT